MKSFIVFVALLLLAVMCFCYGADYNLYMHEMNSLKAVAEECAAGAGLALDYEAYSCGEMVFDREEALSYAMQHFENYLRKIACVNVKNTILVMELCDDSGGYGIKIGASGERNDYFVENEGLPHVTVELLVECEDVFRHPWLDISRLCRVSTYELAKT